MFKRFFVLSVVLFFLVSCSSSYDSNPGNDTPPNLPEGSVLSTPSRKIIYKVEGSFHVKNHTQFANEIKESMLADEWIDYESISVNRAHLTLRIQTARLDAFLVDLQADYSFSSYSKSATDISLNYNDKTLVVEALLAQRARLVALYDEAMFSETLILNQEIAKIDLDLARIQGELNAFDGLIDYSEVVISIYRVQVNAPTSFGDELTLAFYDGINAIVFVARNGLLLIVRLLPISVVAFGVGFGVHTMTRKRKQKKAKLPQEK